MVLNFCPECGSKLQTGFKFCPSCGERLPSLVPAQSTLPVSPAASWVPAQSTPPVSPAACRVPAQSTLPVSPAASWVPAQSTLPVSPAACRVPAQSTLPVSPAASWVPAQSTPPVSPAACRVRAQSTVFTQRQNSPCPERLQQREETDAGPASSIPLSPRSPLHRTRKSTRVTELLSPPIKPFPSKSLSAGQNPKALPSPWKRQARADVNQEEEVLPSPTRSSPAGDQTPTVSPSPRKWPARVKTNQEEEVNAKVLPSPTRSPAGGKSKRMKHASAPEALQEGEQLTDTAGRKWSLVKLLSQSEAELVYGVQQISLGASSADYQHILKLGSKDGKIFNEQNFLQRAAKPTSVKNWMKQKKKEVLGIPSCAGFGLHADGYRFLIFPNMGQTLQSILDEGVVLSEKAVLQLSCRILDVLEYIHENEYVHADIHSENIYVDLTKPTQVYLVGYCHAFRYCPSGKHVEYREGSRTPHEGAVEFISVESHKGAGPSRRSDLQTLGYCALRWLGGALPWTSLTSCPARVMAEKERYMTDVQGLLSQCFGRRRVPGGVQGYLSQVMSLQYSEEPQYQRLRDGLGDALLDLGALPNQPLDLQV